MRTAKSRTYPVLFLLTFISLLFNGVALAQTLTCAGCGGPIEGEYIVVNGATYHPGHFKCDECGGPITGPYTSFQGRNLHDSCYVKHYALICDLCGQQINGEYLSDYWGEKVHKYHKEQIHQCEYCSRIIGENTTGGARIYSDGRYVCERCAQIAITDIDDAEALLDSVKSELATFGIVVEGEAELKFETRKQLARYATTAGPEALGVAEMKTHTSFFGLLESKVFTVHILKGVPRPVLRSVMAHELMHVWQYQNAPENNSIILSEGSCEYASYLILSARTDDPYTGFLLKSKADNTDPVYGDGYRKVSAFVAQEGVERWLEYLQQHADPPWKN